MSHFLVIWGWGVGVCGPGLSKLGQGDVQHLSICVQEGWLLSWFVFWRSLTVSHDKALGDYSVSWPIPIFLARYFDLFWLHFFCCFINTHLKWFSVVPTFDQFYHIWKYFRFRNSRVFHVRNMKSSGTIKWKQSWLLGLPPPDTWWGDSPDFFFKTPFYTLVVQNKNITAAAPYCSLPLTPFAKNFLFGNNFTSHFGWLCSFEQLYLFAIMTALNLLVLNLHSGFALLHAYGLGSNWMQE